MNNVDLKYYLLDDFDVQIKYVDGIISQVNNFSNELKNEFFNYIKDDKHSDITVNGYTIVELKNKYGLNEIGAFLALSWIDSDVDTTVRMLGYGI